jgi:hypothetical protein
MRDRCTKRGPSPPAMADRGRVEGLGQLGGHFRGEVGLTWTEHARERQGAREQGSGGVTRASSPRPARLIKISFQP